MKCGSRLATSLALNLNGCVILAFTISVIKRVCVVLETGAQSSDLQGAPSCALDPDGHIILYFTTLDLHRLLS